MKATYKSESIQDLEHHYGKDIVGELSSMLSNEIAKEIDKQILRGVGIEPDRNQRRKKSIDNIFKQ